MELTPRTAPGPDAPATRPPRRSRWAYGVLAVVLLGLGFVVWQGLTSATLYFYNADEAVAKRTELADGRFRLQGTVLGETIEETDIGVDFTVAFNGVRVDVRHHGDPPELFEPGIPVVLEGRWSATEDHFDSDRMLVKHSANYEADHEDRIDDARDGAADGAPAATSK